MFQIFLEFHVKVAGNFRNCDQKILPTFKRLEPGKLQEVEMS